jgi:hypothetical protein
MTKSQVYVLRIWHEARETLSWRASLTDLSSHEKCYFASSEALVKFVRELVSLEKFHEDG